ncbi:hypothetical protein W02_02500 [Nitrospira sp. KM1]|uniref:PAS domain-containing protein n=1 Tax=Nitrospira sp. KM1 TaxID=1936990 RepID=UPI0013A739AD|nr:PAS domain-containing protein [Nitrospira sp. KM1]BCA53110.1 hypothetical protein W02_02500 [Nitrospira sp. KM1]
MAAVVTSDHSVLVVEDNPDLVIGLQDLLEHEGYQVSVAGTCAEALAQAHSRAFNAVLLDLGLPDGDGLDVLHTLQQLDPSLPVVIVTASTSTEKTIGQLSKGAFAYLIKPYNREELRAILRRAIGVKDLAARAEHAQYALTESENRFRSLVESASDAIVVADQQGYVVSWNQSAARLFGYEKAEIEGRPLTMLMPVRYREAHEMGLDRMRTGAPSKIIGRAVELFGLHKTKREFPIELSLAAWKTREGLFYSGIIRDISERKRVQAAIQESRDRLNLALRAGKLGTWDWSPRSGTVVWSDNAAQLFRLPPGTQPFETFLALIHPEDRREAARKLIEATVTGTEYMDEFRIVGPDGTMRWVACAGQSFRTDGEESVRMIGTLQCVTKQKEAELALRESQGLINQMTDIITDVFWMTDPNKNQILYISPGYETIWGRSCSSVRASPRSWVEAIHPEDRERVLHDSLTKQVSGDYNVEYRITRPDGTIRWIWDRAFPIRNAQGQVYRIAGLAEDITDRKREESTGRHEDEHVRLAMAAAGIGGWKWYVASGRMTWSSELERLFGIAPGSFAGTQAACLECIYPPDRAVVSKMFRRAVKPGSDIRFVHRLLSPDKTFRWLTWVGSAFADPPGSPVQVVGVVISSDRRPDV